MDGHIDTRAYTPVNDLVKMDGWLSSTLYNTGEAQVLVMGINVQPGESFVMGNSTTKLYTEIKLQWPKETDNKICKVVVHYIQPISC